MDLVKFSLKNSWQGHGFDILIVLACFEYCCGGSAIAVRMFLNVSENSNNFILKTLIFD